MIQGYYQARGCNKNGFVSEEKLGELGLKTKQRIQADENNSPKLL
jgi:hypothetical protein